jgi:hypothetical protein
MTHFTQWAASRNISDTEPQVALIYLTALTQRRRSVPKEALSMLAHLLWSKSSRVCWN